MITRTLTTIVFLGFLASPVVAQDLSGDPRVAWLWEVVEEMSPRDRRRLSRFVSGCERLPPRMRVVPLTSPTPDLALPRAATCFHVLELPDYSTKDALRRKLLYAIEACADVDTDFAVRDADHRDETVLAMGGLRV